MDNAKFSESLEIFTFPDGKTDLAWVTYRFERGHGPRAVSFRPWDSCGPSRNDFERPTVAAKRCYPDDCGERSVYTLRDGDGNSQEIVVCMKHGERMPLINDDTVTARPAESDVACDFYVEAVR